jgi:hypothetical protein
METKSTGPTPTVADAAVAIAVDMVDPTVVEALILMVPQVEDAAGEEEATARHLVEEDLAVEVVTALHLAEHTDQVEEDEGRLPQEPTPTCLLASSIEGAPPTTTPRMVDSLKHRRRPWIVGGTVANTARQWTATAFLEPSLLPLCQDKSPSGRRLLRWMLLLWDRHRRMPTIAIISFETAIQMSPAWLACNRAVQWQVDCVKRS